MLGTEKIGAYFDQDTGVQTCSREPLLPKALNLDPSLPRNAVAIAEACNLAAKSQDYQFYNLKPAVMIAAWQMGATFGYSKLDHTFNLFSADIGTASLL